MKTQSEDFSKWLQGVAAIAFTAWAGWISLGFINLQEDVRVIKYRLFGKVAETKQKTEVQQAGAQILPLPEARQK
jgi:hypothetical protein